MMSGATLDLNLLLLYVTAATAVISLLVTIWTLATSGVRRNAALIDAHRQRIEALEHRTQAVEQELRSRPAQHELHAVQIALTEMRGDLRTMQAHVAGMREILGRVETVVTRHEEHLLESNR
jgi:hypothetical protein